MNHRPQTSHAIPKSYNNRFQIHPFGTKLKGRPASAKEWFESHNRKRNEEAWKHEELAAVVNDMKKREWQAKVYTSLSQHKRDISCMSWKEKEEKEKRMKEKREKLGQLFSEDEAKYEREREEKRKANRTSSTINLNHPEIELLRKRLEDLKKQNEDERKKLAEKLSYETWRKNHPDLRDVDSEKFNNFVRDAWVDQKQWREDEKKAREDEVRKGELEAAERRREEEEEERRREEERRQKQMKWKMELDHQVKQLKERDEEEEDLRRREDALEKESFRLQDLIKKREAIKEERKRKNLQLYWARQYQLKLKQKAADIQSELGEDEMIVGQLLRGARKEHSPNEQMEFEKEEGEWMLKVLEEQKKLERFREKEYELLFSEEAEKMWLRRQLDWEKEQRARDKLMEEVMLGLKEQIGEKLSATQRETAAKRRERENLLTTIQDSQQKIESERREEGVDKADKRQGPYRGEERVTPLRERDLLRQETLKKQSIEDHQREIDRLDLEMKKLWQRSYVPPRYGRKRVAW